jgi:hypothetical protein
LGEKKKKKKRRTWRCLHSRIRKSRDQLSFVAI